MPYLGLIAVGGVLTLLGLKGCEMALDRTIGEPKKEIQKVEPITGLSGNTIKNILVFIAGSGAVVGSVYIVKNFLSRR